MMKKNNKSDRTVNLILPLISFIILIVLAGCDVINPPVKDGEITFVDYESADKTINGQQGLIDFGEKLVEMGDRAVKDLKMKNTGEGDLIITNIWIDGTGFSFPDDVSPSFPLIIPEGETINDVFVEFAPLTGGEFSGVLYLETVRGTEYFNLTGIGLWQLTLSVAATGDDSQGKIISPVEVLIGESEILTSTDGIFDLECELNFLYEFVGWNVDSVTGDAPEFENQQAKSTDVTLKSHTDISIIIRNPFNRVNLTGLNPSGNPDPDYYTSIQGAIDDCISNGNIAVIVSEGTYNQSFTMATNVPVSGGYNSAWSDRDHLNRTSYQTIINGNITASGSSIKSNVILEGFVITGDNVQLFFESGTTAVLQNNTITGSGNNPAVTIDGASNVIQKNIITGGSGTSDSVGLFIANPGSPRILNNTISSGSTSAAFSEAYGIKIIEGSSPIIYKNTINGGSAGGTGSESFGIFNDFECEPLVRGNSINGGTASGSGGQSYGIYMINNGKVTADYNSINGGSGDTAYGLYVAYGGNLYLDYNNIYTSSGASNRYGIFIGSQGRVRRLLNNGIYDCPDSLFHTSIPSDDKTDIDDVNDHFHTDSNSGSAIAITIPAEEPVHE